MRLLLLLLGSCCAVAAEPAPDWPRLVEQVRAPGVSAANKQRALARFIAGNQPTLASLRMALVFRALDGVPGPAGTFTHRVTLEECTRMTEVLRRKPALLPALGCKDVVRWQRELDEGWRAQKPAAGRATASALIASAAPLRDALEVVLGVHANPKQYFADLFGVSLPQADQLIQEASAVRELLFELVAEADLLAAEGGSIGDCEEFLVRYPTHPFAASALFAAGHFERLRAQFPGHPLALKR